MGTLSSRWAAPVRVLTEAGIASSMALVWDRALKPHVEKYARDSEAFFDDFARSFSRLLELGEC